MLTKTNTTHFTRLIHLSELDKDLYLKIEYENPVAAMKFRAIPPFIRHILNIGEVKPGQTVAMRSAGSAAVAMAWTAVQIGLKPVAVLPPVAPPHIIRMLRWIGAEVHIVASDVATKMIKEYKEMEDIYVFGQAGESRLIDLYGPVGREIAEQLPTVAAVTVGIGTGISVTGIAKEMAQSAPDAEVYGCEPAEAPIASGGKWAPHRIPGLAPPIPQPLLDKELLAGIVTVPSQAAWDQAAEMVHRFGILAGPSSGCTVAAALKLREQGVVGPIVAVQACNISEYLK